jgi:cytochrome P450
VLRNLGREVRFACRYADASDALRDEHMSCDPFALKTPEELASIPAPPDEMRPLIFSLMSSDPPNHTRLRALVKSSFSGPAMDALRPKIQRITDSLLDTIEREAASRGEAAPHRAIDLIASYAYPLPLIVISEVLGIPTKDQDQVRLWTEPLTNHHYGRSLAPRTRDNLKQLNAYLRALFVAKRQRPDDGLISKMLRAQAKGATISEDEIISLVVLIYMAGHTTTLNLIGNSVLLLLTHPDQLSRFRADPTLVHGVVEETLRYWGPVDNVMNRRATSDTAFGGNDISRGERVFIGLASAGRDPARFKDPDTFDISRPDASRHLAFGRGIHLCLGAPLARIEGQIAIATLFARYPALRLAEPASAITWAKTTLRGFKRIPVTF